MTTEMRLQCGENIRGGRSDLGLRQEDLAAVLRVRQSTVSKWERGLQMPREGMKARIAEILHKDVQALFPPSQSKAA
jgi:transcriptional regulator with XRE-family HTH domain